ncbi:uncharacterized protein [Ptychodera flava]|uniref:uncharacterized protein n=1 Tax=Ptychodera flava TaxID=63121 RepID=UPI00396A64E4
MNTHVGTLPNMESETGNDCLTALERACEEEINKVKEHAKKVAVKLREDEQKLIERLKSEYESQKKQVVPEIKQPTVHLEFLPDTSLLDDDRVILGNIGALDVKKTKVGIPKYVLVGDSEDLKLETFDFYGNRAAGSNEYDRVSVEATCSGGARRELDVSHKSGGKFTFKFSADTEGVHLLSVSISGREMPGSPFHVSVLSIRNYVEKVKIGSLVARGKNWEYKNEDGNPPGKGRVTRKQGDDVTVQWDCGNQGSYFMEASSGYFQLKLAECH